VLQDTSRVVTNDFRTAQAAFERKDYDTAVRLLNTLLAAQPDQTAAYELRALAHGYQGRPEEALADHDHLVQAGQEKGDLLRRICVSLLTHLLAQGQEIVRGAAAIALAELGPADTLAALNLALQDSSPRVRTFAIQTTGRFGLAAKLPVVRDAVKDPAALSVLTLGLSDPDAAVRSFAAGALGDLGAPSAITALVDALSDRDPYVRNFAADSLGRLNAKAAIGALWGAVKDSDSLV